MRKVVKFGGSSLASARQFKKVKSIITADKTRCFVVPSAPGKRDASDTKVTDLLYQCYEAASTGQSYKRILEQIKKRFYDIIDDKVYLNGSETPLDEPYLAEEMNQNENFHFEVPEDCYFMMGDNRNYSADARYWRNPYISKDKMIAKVLVEYFPTPKIIK